MDTQQYFREATLRICGNLEIEMALHELLALMSEYMPVDMLYLQYYDYEYEAMRTIAYASATECKKLDLLTPLSEESKERAGNVPPEIDVFLIDDPQSFPVSREMENFHNAKSNSIIILFLRSKGEVLGFLILVSNDNEGFKSEHLDYVQMLKEPLVIAMANTLKHREIVKLNDLLADENLYLHRELRRLTGDEIVGANFGLRDVMHKVRQVAALDSPVLLLGETGVGKDVIANAIHYSSTRSDGPFVSVNCGAIPDSLIDSELFGHEKGAFTGALSQKRGRFERANRGTIFLDEIGELPLQAQVRLLRVLQSREIERVGGDKTISLDLRIIAATNRNLAEMVQNQHFREDLWFRLNVFPIWIPPLRQRKADIPTLVKHFIDLKAKELKLRAIPVLTPGSTDLMLNYAWPGNVRELQNVIERALILNPAGPLNFDHLTPDQPINCAAPEPVQSGSDNLDEVIAGHIQRVLNKTQGKVNGPDGAAALLGINPSTLRNRMKKLGVIYGRNAKN
jgi:transcriptional regulator with GAF, ATPase, and Fis domain